MRGVIAGCVFIYLTLLTRDARPKQTDAPECADVKLFLDVIEQGLKFTENISTDDDVGFGLLFVRENLERISRFMKISHRQPLDLLKRVNDIRFKVKKQLMLGHFTMIGALYEKLFIVPLTKDFTKKRSELDQTPIPTTQEQFETTRDYLKAVMSIDLKWNSTLNMCLGSMLQRLNNKKMDKKSPCKIHKHCHRFIVNGPNFGYGLARRLIALMIPNAHHCYLLSAESDQKLLHKFCSAMYHELVYIASNNYLLSDLLMEQISLCSSLGYSHFINRRWLLETLGLQEDTGCFQNPQVMANFAPRFFNVIGYNELSPQNMADMKQYQKDIDVRLKLERHCSPHLTAVSMAAASAAARYTIESCLDKYHAGKPSNAVESVSYKTSKDLVFFR